MHHCICWQREDILGVQRLKLYFKEFANILRGKGIRIVVQEHGHKKLPRENARSAWEQGHPSIPISKSTSQVSHILLSQRQTYRGRVEFGVHDEATLLPVDLPEVLLAGTSRVNSSSIDLHTL